jgi:WD40 repeat protein
MAGLKGHNKQINHIIALKDQQHLVSVGNDATARVWSICDQ